MKLTTSKFFISGLVAIVIALPLTMAAFTSIKVGNPAPEFTVFPTDSGSDTDKPLHFGEGLVFSATATDLNGDDYYFAVCKSDSITPQISSKPVCNDGDWGISGLTKSGSPAQVTYTAAKDAKIKNEWSAFVCDNVPLGPSCSKPYSGKGKDGSPFYVMKQVGALRFGNDCPDIAALNELKSQESPDQGKTLLDSLSAPADADALKSQISEALSSGSSDLPDSLKTVKDRLGVLKDMKKKNGTVSDVQIGAVADYAISQRARIKKLAERNASFCITNSADDSIANIAGDLGKTAKQQSEYKVSKESLKLNFSKDENRTITMDFLQKKGEAPKSAPSAKGPEITYRDSEKGGKFLSPADAAATDTGNAPATQDIYGKITLKHENYAPQLAADTSFFGRLFGSTSDVQPVSTDESVYYDLSSLPSTDDGDVTTDKVVYQSSDNRKTDIYNYKNDPTSVIPNQIKNYTIYNYGTGTENELYSFSNTVLHLREDGVIEGYYVDSTDISGQQGTEGVSQDLLARASAVIAKDQILDLHTNGGQNPVFTIPAPFAVDTAGNVIEGLTYEIIGEGFNQLKVSFVTDVNAYPVVLDPTVLFTAPGGAGLTDTITGNTYFGQSMTAGDFNNDGKTDLAVGAYTYNSSQGRIYIFYNDGNIPTTSDTADVIITGQSTSQNFGYALTSGDFDYDGKTDIAVGAYYYSTGNGRVYLFYQDATTWGTSSCTTGCSATNADLMITSSSALNFGKTLSAYDLNTDGRTDLIAGSNTTAYVFYNDGSYTTSSTSADVIISSSDTGFSNSFIADDFNSDGKIDLAVGASNHNSGQGRAYIFYQNGTTGSTFRSDCTTSCTSASHANVIITGQYTSSWFGYSLASADLNGDTKKDLIVGAPNYSSSGGRVHIFYQNGTTGSTFRSDCTTGCTSASNTDILINGATTSEQFGFSLATADFNSDGYTDFAVGSYNYSSSNGGVMLFYNDGSIPTSASSADVIIKGIGSAFGYSLASGDFNGDGSDDLAVGNSSSTTTAKTYIFYGDSGQQLRNTITGESSSQFGFSIGSGDFNNDGRVDLVVGAQTYSSNTGRAYIFYNDGNITTTASSADVVIAGDAGGNRFGYSFASGDFNYDGKTDLAIGAYGASKAYIFYNDGSIPTTAGSADVIISGENSGDSFGIALASGDFNADGKTDLAVTAPSYSSQAGRLYIFYNDGSIPTTAGTADVIITGEANTYFGGYTVVAGDFNADGKTDIATGANTYSTSTGRAYIFYNDGSFPSTAATADVIITGAATYNNFGIAESAGDFNGDGKTDLAVGAFGAGKAYIFYNDGSIPTSASSADVIITGSDYFGDSFASGDFNADGRTDLAVGAPNYSTYTGNVYIFYNDGSIPTTAAIADVIITGESTNNYFGYGLASGDFNADGRTDLAVGAYGYSSNAGRVYILYGEGKLGSADMITGAATSNYFGYSLASGDFNYDGKTDLAVGAYSASSAKGRVYIFYNDGSIPTSASSADVIITGEPSSDFGRALTTGDFNTDGTIDLAVGSINYPTGTGTTYIFYNDGTIPKSAVAADVIITGESSSNFGYSLTSGDFNYDTRTDLAVGAYYYSSQTGRAYIFYNDGSIPTTAATADVIITGESSSNFGISLASGDLNADGTTDLIVGAPNYTTNYGRAYIFYNDGSYTTAASSADVIITGYQVSYFGTSIATGDFNSDTSIDLAVGAHGYNTYQGRSYIFYNDGSIPTAAESADVKITGESSSYFGVSLASGDFNYDGRTDIAVGAYTLDRAYIFYNDGSIPTAASSADVIMTGDSSSYFGNSLVSGDFNYDTRTDLAVGARTYSTNTGRVYIYYAEKFVVNANTPITPSYTNLTTTGMRLTWASGGSQTDYAYGTTSSCLDGTTTNAYLDITGQTANSSVTRYVCARDDQGNKTAALTLGPYYTAADAPTTPGYTNLTPSGMRFTWINIFAAVGQAGQYWYGMTATPSGDVYINVNGGDIYKKTGGTGNFIALGQTSRSWRNMVATPNGDVYAVVANGDIYKQTGGTGDFVALNQTNRDWRYMTATPSGDVYVTEYLGDIYKQTGGTGDFVALNQTSRNWLSIVAAPNGDIYASVYNGDIYKQTGGTGDFIGLGQTGRYWIYMTTTPNGDVYAADFGGSIYKQTGGTGNFISLNQTSRSWYYMVSTSNGDVYAVVANGDIYKQTGGTGNFVALNQTSRDWRNMVATPNGDVYINVYGGDIYKLSKVDYAYGTTSSCLDGSVSNTYLDIIGQSANTSVTRYVCAVNGDGIKTSALTIGSYYTAADTPSAPTLSNPTTTTIDVNPVTGGAEKDMSIYVKIGASCNYSGGLGYIQANGSISTTEVYQTDSAWGTITVTGLSAGAQYSFCSRARNNDNVVTSVGPAGTVYTVANTPTTPGYTNLTISGMRLTWNGDSGNFIALGQTSRSWYGMAAAPNGDVYAATNGDIYKQTGGAGDFTALGQTSRAWYGITVAPNGDVYAVVYNGDIYKQTGGAGDFVALSQTSRAWFGIAAAPNGDVYAVVYNGDIYKQTGGAGDFVALSQTSRAWMAIAAAPNGDMYATVLNGDIYKQTGGTGNFTALSQTSRGWRSIAVAPNGDVYASTYNADIYKQTGGTGNFTALSQTSRSWFGITAAPNGDVYASSFNGDIYKRISTFAYGTTSSCLDGTTTNKYLDITGQSANTAVTRYVCAVNDDGIKTSALTIGPYYTAANIPTTPGYTNLTTSGMRLTWASGGLQTDYAYGTTSSCLDGITTNTYLDITGQSANASVTRYICAKNADGVKTSALTIGPFYTAADTPTTPSYTNLTTSGMRLTWVSGGAQTDYAYGTTSSCLDGTTTNTYLDITGQSANASLTRYVCAKNADGIKTSALTLGSYYTAASTPSAPTITSPTGTGFSVNPVSGGAEKEMAIYLATGSSANCDGTNGTGYIQANGTVSGTSAWQTDAAWDTSTVSGLSQNTYYVCSKARNGDNIETSFGSASSVSLNTAPSFTSGPSDGGSSSAAPTNAGTNVTFTAAATDSESNQYYLAVCKTDSITPNSDSAPSCASGQTWAVSTAVNSGSQASVTYTASSGDPESDGWYAFVCDKTVNNPMCSSVSQGTGNNGSPFNVNHSPTFGTVTVTDTSGGTVEPGDILRFTISHLAGNLTDADTDPSQDTVTMHICTSATTGFDYSSNTCTGGTLVCSSSAVNPATTDASCDESANNLVPVPTANGPYSFKVYIEDQHDMEGTGTHTQSYTVTEVLPVLVPGNEYALSTDTLIPTAGDQTSLTASARIQDNNGENRVTGGSAVFWDADSTTKDCTASDRNCYIVSSCTVNTSYGNSAQAEVQCEAPLWFNANASSNWKAHINVIHQSGTITSFEDSSAFQVQALAAISVDQASMSYGSISVGGVSSGQISTFMNVGNQPIDAMVQGTDMTSGSYTIPKSNLRFSNSSQDFSYESGYPLVSSASAGTETTGCINRNISVRSSYTDGSSNENIYWKLKIPVGQHAGHYTGSITVLSANQNDCTGTEY